MKPLLKWLLLLAVIIVACNLLVPGAGVRNGSTKKLEAINDMFQFRTAFEGYKTEYGFYPQGDFAVLIKTLGGQNPRGIVFMEFPAKRLDSIGRYLDPWGTPYHIARLTESGRIQIRSYGINQVDDAGRPGSDDLEIN